MTIAHPSRTNPAPGSARPGDDSRSPSHTCRHDFLLLTQDLPSATTPAAEALRPVVAARRGGWVGHSPTASALRATYHDDVCAHPVPLNRTEIDNHLIGHCETSIATVYLDTATPPSFDTAWADAYRSVNDRFAAVAADLAATGGVVLIVGHQLQLVPALLRQRRPDLLIAFFLDLPFPSGEMFRRMPLRHDVLTGVLGADLIGFQTERSAGNFRRLALDDADVRLGRGGLDLDGRAIGIGVFPQSVDAAVMRTLATRPGHQERVRAVRTGLDGPQRIVLAVDDLHAAAGIEPRLAAYGQMLDSGEVDPDHTALIQIVRPDPTDSPTARDLRARIEHQIGLINGRHGRGGRPALHYQHRTPDQTELVALYCAADVLWATPLRAETSLVAKEYLATRSDNSGAVILSEFCGAVDELAGADLANPSDIDHLRRVVLRVLHDNSTARRNRMATMRRHVHAHDIHHWAGNLLAALGQSAASLIPTADRR